MKKIILPVLSSNMISFTVLRIVLIIFLFSFSTFSQTLNYKDRLGSVRDLINSTEMIMIWSQGESQSSQFCYQRIYDLDLTHPGGVDSTLIKKPIQIDSAISGNKSLAVASGNFLAGSFKHFAAAWEGPGNSITVSVPQIQSGTLSWTNSHRSSLTGLAAVGKRKIHIESGNFFGNGQDEFVVAFQGADTTVHLQLYSFNSGSLVPQMKGSINDESSMNPNSFLNDWNIVSGDFDSDGYDDLALLFVKPMGASNWSLFISIYSIDENGNFIKKSSQEVFQQPAYIVTEINIDGAAGSFDGDAAKEIVFGFSFFQGDEPGNDTYAYFIDVKNNLNTIIVNDARRVARNFVGENDMPPLNVAAGDLNNDYSDELILMSGSTFYIYSTDEQLLPQFKSQRSVSTEGDNLDSDAFLTVEDMDLDLRSEIVVAKSFVDFDPGGLQHFEIHVFSLDTLLTTYTLKAKRMNEEPISRNTGIRRYAVALGDFNGDRTRLGDPVHYRRTGVMQPTVVLYTPPIHYDVFDNVSYDLCGCYPTHSCGFSSTYIQSTTIDTTITTEIHEDWGGDASITSAVGILKLKVKATYGDKFSRKESSSSSFTVTTGRVAAGDDWLYANVYDIDFYEYPVYDSLITTPIGYFLVTIPNNPRPLWIELKDDDLLGNQFRPDHETGNILSYRATSTFDTSRVIVNFLEQTVGSTGNSFVALQMQSFLENGVESSWDAGLEIGATLDLMGDISGFDFGMEIEVNGHYNYGEIYTQTVKVQESLEVRGDLGHLDTQFGTSGTYYVQPYAYWTSYGALALDYKVTQLPLGANSFWQERYGGKSDLAFSLPWRYDAEKGYPFPGNDSSYRQRSRDVYLSKIDPLGGDSVYLFAKVRNFGLQAVTSPFVVKFFNGDPNLGGIQIAETVVDTVIAARSYRNVILPWYIPLNAEIDTMRIYAVIDQENTITNEIHENNNTGWAPVVGYGSLVGVEPEIKLPEEFLLHQSYPNPFNPSATISFELPSSGNVSLKIFNMLGEEVEVLINDFRTAGKHNIQFNGNGLASGVYFYRLQAGKFVQTKKMMLIK